MAKPLVSDALWERIAPLSPPEPPKPKGGRPRVPDRACLAGIIFVLKGGMPWEMLPQELGCGSGMTCWRRLRYWQDAGVWDRLHQTALDDLGSCRCDRLGASLLWTVPVSRRKGGRGDRSGPDESRQPGTKRHRVADHAAPPSSAV